MEWESTAFDDTRQSHNLLVHAVVIAAELVIQFQCDRNVPIQIIVCIVQKLNWANGHHSTRNNYKLDRFDWAGDEKFSSKEKSNTVQIHNFVPNERKGK